MPAVQNASNCCTVLKVHGQCAQGMTVFFGTLVVVLFISKCAQGMCSLVWKFIVVISSTCMFGQRLIILLLSGLGKG